MRASQETRSRASGSVRGEGQVGFPETEPLGDAQAVGRIGLEEVADLAPLDLLRHTRHRLGDVVHQPALLLDLAIVALQIDEPEIARMPLFEDRFHVAVPPGHPLAKANAVPQRMLATENLLLLEEGHCLRDQALSFCNSFGATRQMEEFGATSLATIVQMVASGYGIALLPEMALPVEVRDPRIVEIRPIEPLAPSRTVGLVWRRPSPRQEDFAELGRLIVETAKTGWLT